jgi:hypothetical protein
VVNPSDQPQTIPLFAVDRPFEGRAPPAGRYHLRGEVQPAGIVGRGYLEMWSVFSGRGRFFSRTLAETGPLGVLTGSSAPHAFVLPFDALEPIAPERIEVNVFLPPGGAVLLGPLELGEGWPDELAGPLAASPWGAAAGSILGLLGALIGTLIGMGRGRRVALLLLDGAIVLSALLLLAALAARASWIGAGAELWLPGAIGAAVFLPLRGIARRRYQNLELSRIRAMDASFEGNGA